MTIKRIYVVCKLERGTVLMLNAFDDRASANYYLKSVKDRQGFFSIQTVDYNESVQNARIEPI